MVSVVLVEGEENSKDSKSKERGGEAETYTNGISFYE